MSYKHLTKSYITSIYNTRISCYTGNNILLVHKQQDVPGTTDEKLPFLFESIKKVSFLNKKIIVLSGSGWRESVLDWAESEAANSGILLFFNSAEADKYVTEYLNGR